MADACGSTPGTLDYGPQGRVILPSPWSSDLTTVPRSFDETKIEAYRASTLASSRQVARSNKFLTEAYVDPASVQVLRSTTGVLIKASCFRSQRKTATPYQVVCDIQQSGDVRDANCECAAGKSGACNHSLAVLKLLALLRANKYDEAPPAVACTELPQQWRRPRGEAVASTSLQLVDWRSVREEGLETPITSRLYDAQRNIVDVNDRVALTRQLGDYLFSTQGSPFAKRLRAATTETVKTKFGLAPPGSPLAYQQSLVPFGYETFSSPELAHVQGRSAALPSCPAFFEACTGWDMSGLNFPVEQDLLLKQAKSPLWKAARRTRLTASCFGQAVERESWTLKGLNNLTSSKDLSRVRAVRHGIKYEPVAVQRYESCLRALGHDVQTFPCGILVHPECPWLGASPDRVVWDPTETTPHGVVEVKCPYTLKDGGLNAASNFYMTKDAAGVYRLNRDHKHYHQILGQMALSGLQWGDFVVYSHKFLIVERIYFSEDEWLACKAALDDFYFSVLLPYLCRSST
ncbi:uncharacterized protein ISCGN_002796 [Ixodes scapularis]